jgi:hypothetical protein
MATYKEIQEYVKDHYGCTLKTCWIAHVKELNGLKPRVAHNRISADHRKHPCPDSKRPLIEEAMRYYGMI